jgi:CHAT domain-containing protein
MTKKANPKMASCASTISSTSTCLRNWWCLSACETGLGKEVKGEGLVGLTRGFMYAGSRRVVVSLWSVNDVATSEVMAKFYQKMLQEGQNPVSALRAAQLEMWNSQQWQAPYYWAAFTIQGDWR